MQALMRLLIYKKVKNDRHDEMDVYSSCSVLFLNFGNLIHVQNDIFIL